MQRVEWLGTQQQLAGSQVYLRVEKGKPLLKKTHSILARGHMVDSEIMWSNTTNINLFVYQTESHVLHK